MRIPVTFEVDVRQELPDESQKNRLVTPLRAEILLGGERTGAYAIMEVGPYGPPLEYMKEELVRAAVQSFVGRMNKALTIARDTDQ